MKWTKRKPVKEGWYWVLCTTTGSVGIFRCVYRYRELIIKHPKFEEHILSVKNFYFAGPIPMPKDLKKWNSHKKN